MAGVPFRLLHIRTRRLTVARIIDLDVELRTALGRVRDQHLSALVNAGVSAKTIAEIGAKQVPFGVGRVDFRQGRIYEPSGEPFAIGALIIPVFESGTLIDLIALRLLQPGLWKWRTGEGFALGADEIEFGTPWSGFAEIELHATPIDWLAATGKGACILNYANEVRIRSLSQFDRIIVTNHRVMAKIEPILSRPARKPEIIRKRAQHGRKAA